MCGGFRLEGDDWNNTMHLSLSLSPSCGVKQQAPWWEAADRMEQLRAPLPPPDNHNIFLPLSSSLSLSFSCLTGRQEAAKGDRGEEGGVRQQSAPYLVRPSQELSRAPTGSRQEQLIHCNRDSTTKHDSMKQCYSPHSLPQPFSNLCSCSPSVPFQEKG